MTSKFRRHWPTLLFFSLLTYYTLLRPLPSPSSLPPPLPLSSSKITKTLCPQKLDFLSGKASLIQLSSFPGSGNTWIRHLLQKGSGFYTGSTYDDATLKREFPGESVRDGTVIAIKTHFPCGGCWWAGVNKDVLVAEKRTKPVVGYEASVQVLRSPFGAMLSDFNHAMSGANHTGMATHEQLFGEEFEGFVKARIEIWTRHALYYLKTKVTDLNAPNRLWREFRDEKSLPVLLVYFEDLKNSPIMELQNIFAFIKKASGDKDEFLAILDPSKAAKCAVANDPVGRFRRAKAANNNSPYDRPLSSGTTLRIYVCEYVRDKCALFWKRNDQEWGCDDVFMR